MKFSTETKAGILVACSFLGLTGVFVGKNFLDPKTNLTTLLSEGNPDTKPSDPDAKPEVKDPKEKNEIDPGIVQTNSKVTLPGGIPSVPGSEKPAPTTGFPPPLGTPPPLGNPQEAFPGGLPPLPGTELPTQNNNIPGSKPDPLGVPPLPPPTGFGPSSGIPPLPGEFPPGNSPAPIDNSKSIPGTIPFPVPLGAAVGGAVGAIGAAPATGAPPSGLSPIPPLVPGKEVNNPSSVPSRGLGGSEFSSRETPGLPNTVPPLGVPVPMNPGLASPGLFNPGTGALGTGSLGTGSLGTGSLGTGARGAFAVAIPSVTLTTFSPTTGPIKRTEFIPLDEPVTAPLATPFVPGLPNLAPTPVPSGPSSDNPGNMVRRPAPGSNPNFAFVPSVPATYPDRPILRMSANETNPRLGTVGLQGNAPKVSSWSEKVFISSPGDTWDSIALSQYQRKDLARMLQQYNELHPRLAALPKTGFLPQSTEIFLPPLEELIRQGTGSVPVTNPQPGTFSTGIPGRP